MMDHSNNQNNKQATFLMILALLTLLGLFIVFLLPPIPQRLAYHQFADTRPFLGIPNFLNVVSNLPFALLGLWGYWALSGKFKVGQFISWQEAIPFIVLFTGVFLISIGSAYYHWKPTNQSLVWDRMPMAVVFTTLVTIAFMERINFTIGLCLLAPLVIFGVWTVWYWGWTEALGRGDMRLYGFVQFYSIILLITILCLFPKPANTLTTYVWIILFYALAKILELADSSIYQLGGVISGHTLKHLAAAISTCYFVVLVKKIQFTHPDKEAI